MKQSKYEYLYIVQGHYAHGWEDLDASETQAEARANLKAYRENEPETPTRIVHRRVPTT